MKLRWGLKLGFNRQKKRNGITPMVENEAVRHRLEFRRQLQKKPAKSFRGIQWRNWRLRGGGWQKWLAILTIGGAGYLVFGSRFFWLDELKVSGSHLATQEQITEVLFPKGFSGANAVYWPEGLAGRRLLARIPQISEVEFKKNLINNTLVVLVKEHQTSIIWQTAGEKFLVNRFGVVYDKAGEGAPLIMVEDLKNVPVGVKQKVVAPDFIEFVTSFVANLPRKTNISINRVTIPETTFEVEMYTNQKWRIILDTTRPMDDQLNALVRVLREVGEDTPREYVDLRIPNKVFYK